MEQEAKRSQESFLALSPRGKVPRGELSRVCGGVTRGGG